MPPIDTIDPVAGTDANTFSDGQLDLPQRQNTVTVRRITVGRRRLVAKVATGRSRAALRAEADLMHRIGGGLVAEVVAVREHDERTDLIVLDVGAQSLADLRHLGGEERLLILRNCANSLESLHRRGWSHGALCAEHVVIDEALRVRFCSIGSARPALAEDPERSADVQQLLAMARWVLDAPRPPDTSLLGWWATRRAVRRCLFDGAPPTSAIEVGERLAQLERQQRIPMVSARPTTGRLDRPDRAAGTAAARRSTLRRLRAPLALLPARGSVAAVTATGLFVVALGVSSARTAPERRAEATSTGAVQPLQRSAACDEPTEGSRGDLDLTGDGCADRVVIEDNLVEVDGVRYRIGRSGDQPVVGDLDCDGDAGVLVLRPGSGELFHFDGLATTARPRRGRLLTAIPGASAVESPSEVDCGPLRVALDTGRTVSVPLVSSELGDRETTDDE